MCLLIAHLKCKAAGCVLILISNTQLYYFDSIVHKKNTGGEGVESALKFFKTIQKSNMDTIG